MTLRRIPAPDPQAIASLKEVMDRHGLLRCDACGACAVLCPMHGFFGERGNPHAPKRTIRRLLHVSRASAGHKVFHEALHVTGLWRCLTCDVCLSVCPQDVHFRDFAAEMRERAIEAGAGDDWAFCRVCGKPYLPVEILERLRSMIDVPKTDEILDVCPACRPRYQGRKVLETMSRPIRDAVNK